MHRYHNCVRVIIPDKHVMATLNPVQPKPEFLQRPNRVFTGNRRVGRHQRIPTMRFSSTSFAAASGILL
jgi:hypothetical protein